MEAGDILTKARYTLSDDDKSRWSDDRLLSLLNDALLDVALSTRLYNATGYIKLQDNTSIYDISSFAIKVERVEYLNNPLEKVSFNEMDDLFGTSWQEEANNKPTHIIYDLKRAGEFVVYPTPKSGAIENVNANSPYGIITQISYEDIELNIIGNLGDLSPPNRAKHLKLYYISAPQTLVSVTDKLEAVIDRTMLSQLAHYVAGAALRDNMDGQNRKVGNEELKFYQMKKQDLIDQKTRGDVKRVRVTNYRGMG